MRSLRLQQLFLCSSSSEAGNKNPLLDELEVMSEVLDECPGMEAVYELALCDLVGEKCEDRGSAGLTAEQVLRAGIVRDKFGFGYRELEFHLMDSKALGNFVRLPPLHRATKSALNRDLRSISDATWEALNECLKQYAKAEGIEDGQTIRGDTTATETNIQYPTDSNLLWDCIRVTTRLLNRAQEQLADLHLDFSNHNRRAKSRRYQIHNAKSAETRRRHYRDLIMVSERVRDYARDAVEKLAGYESSVAGASVAAKYFEAELSGYLELFEKVISQTIRRVLNGEKVPVSEKVVSIFETHTDVIKKGGRETVFGHKVFLSSGKSGLVLDCITLKGNPADDTLIPEVLERHIASYGKAPEQAAFDGGFASRDNREKAKKVKVEDIAFSCTKGMEVETLTRSKEIFKALRKFRAGIEAAISTLKRKYTLSRVLAKGWEAFKAALKSAVVTFNLTLIARHKIEACKT